MVGALALMMVSLVASGCFFDYCYERHLVGPYSVVAIENSHMLGVDRESEDATGVYAGRIPAVVIDVGWNDHYIVASQRPPEEPGGALVYYYIDVAKDGPGGAPDGAVIGPLAEDEFAAAKAELHLPEFSMHYPELR